MSFTIKGIDVSKWQDKIDWQKVKNDGIKFAMIRCGYGTSYEDPTYRQNIKGAKEAGILVGVYLYSYATTEQGAIDEAKWTLQLLKGVDLDYPVAFDIEDKSQAGLGKDLLTRMIIAYTNTIKAAGYRAMVYFNTNWRNNLIDMSKISDIPLWQAHYPFKDERDMNKVFAARPTAIDSRTQVWQASDKGKVNGINGDVDMNWDLVDMIKFNPDPLHQPPASTPQPPATNSLGYVKHIIASKDERKTSGFRIPSRPNHNGTDFTDMQRKELTAVGMDIVAFADGEVTDTTIGASIGWSVSILHSGRLLTRYFHMRANSVVVKKGDKVKAGQKIGVMGSTGDSTGPHVHFETKENSNGGISGDWVNPELYLLGQKVLPEDTVKPNEPKPVNTNISVGNRVRVNSGAKTYNGGGLASFVYNTVYEVSEIKGDRVVIGLRNAKNIIETTAAINVKDLVKVA